jgi:hypothetical protein
LSATAERTRKQYEERAYLQFEKWESERQLMKKEIEELQKQLPSKNLFNEIAATENAIGRSQQESRMDVDREIASADALGQLLQKKAQQLELQAYLRGLKFACDRASVPSGVTNSGFIDNVQIVNPSMTNY